MTKATWQFGEAERETGFANITSTRANQIGAGAPMRELLQNAMDATLPGQATRVRCTIMELDWEQLPDGDALRTFISERVRYRRTKEQQSVAKKYMDDIEYLLDEMQIPALVVTDAGRGIDEPGMQGLLSDGNSAKKPGNRGSFGLGHHEMKPASTLRCVCYAGRHQAGQVAGGEITLATGRPGTETSSENGFLRLQKARNTDNFHVLAENEHLPTQLEWLLNKELEALGTETGSIVLITGFNMFGAEKAAACIQEMAGAVARNFGFPLQKGTLEVDIIDARDTSAGRLQLDMAAAETLLADRAAETRRTKNEIISWAQGYEAWLTMRDGEAHPVEYEGESIDVYVRPLQPSESTVVQLHRDGMYITDSRAIANMPIIQNSDAKLQSIEPHHIVIHAQQAEAPNACRLIRAGEGPQHSSVDAKLMNDQDANDARGLFRYLRDAIVTSLPERQTDTEWTSDYLSFTHHNKDTQRKPGERRRNKLERTKFRKAPKRRRAKRNVEPRPKPEDHEGRERMPPGEPITGVRATHIESDNGRHDIVIHLPTQPKVPEAFEIRLERDDGKPADAGTEPWRPEYATLTSEAHCDDATIESKTLKSRSNVGRAIAVRNPTQLQRVLVHVRTNGEQDATAAWRIHVTEPRYQPTPDNDD